MKEINHDLTHQTMLKEDCKLPEDVEAALRVVLPRLQAKIHHNAILHGFWESVWDRNPLAKLMLVTTELAEAAEAIRNDTAEEPCDKPGLQQINQLEEEIADAIIRLLDLGAVYDLNITKAILAKHEYNRTRPYKHGKTC